MTAPTRAIRFTATASQIASAVLETLRHLRRNPDAPSGSSPAPGQGAADFLPDAAPDLSRATSSEVWHITRERTLANERVK